MVSYYYLRTTVNESSLKRLTNPCPSTVFARFLKQQPFSVDCVSINATKLIFKTRTWNCLCILDIFNPTYNSLDVPAVYPVSIVRYPSSPHAPIPFWKATVPVFNILFSACTITTAKTQDWMDDVMRSSDLCLYGEVVFYICRVTQMGRIEDILNYDELYGTPKKITMADWGKLSFVAIAKRSLILWRDRRMWTGLVYLGPSFSGIESAFESCNLDFEIRRRHSISFSKPFADIASAYIVQLIMGNFSYWRKDSFVCQHPGVTIHEADANVPETSSYLNRFVPLKILGDAQLALSSLVIRKTLKYL